jgi:hypothetical protein
LEILAHKMNRVMVPKAIVHISCQFLKGTGNFGKKNYVTHR